MAQRGFRVGDVLQCASCGHEFVLRKVARKGVACARCRTLDVKRWKPAP